MSQKNSMILTAESLVRYDPPVLLSISERPSQRGRPLRVSPNQSLGSDPVPPSPKQKRVSFPDQTEEILSAVLPPREWVEGKQVWVQRVSRVPGTRADVLRLEEKLDIKMKELGGKETGVCPVRRELYSQCFDELMRQAAVSCVELGVMFMRVRDEIRMTLAAYETLYHSGLAFGVRKSVQTEKDVADLEERLSALEIEQKELEKKLEEQNGKHDALKRREGEEKELRAEEDGQAGEIHILRKINQQLKNQVEDILKDKTLLQQETTESA